MKKTVLILFIPIVVAAVLFMRHPRSPEPLATVATPQTQQTTCYERSVEATETAPYSVHENIQLTIDNTAVSGTKVGTQTGPDMTNGYEGTLTGTTGDPMVLLYAYTIEGSAQKEEEQYTLQNNRLIKHRYPLVEKNKILIPDTTKDATDQVYEKVPCKLQ